MPKHSPCCGEIPTPLPPKATGLACRSSRSPRPRSLRHVDLFDLGDSAKVVKKKNPVVEIIELYMNLKTIFAALEPCHGPRNQWSFTKSGDFLIGGRCAEFCPQKTGVNHQNCSVLQGSDPPRESSHEF